MPKETRAYEIRTNGHKTRHAKYRVVIVQAEDVTDALKRFDSEYRRTKNEVVQQCRALKN